MASVIDPLLKQISLLSARTGQKRISRTSDESDVHRKHDLVKEPIDTGNVLEERRRLGQRKLVGPSVGWAWCT